MNRDCTLLELQQEDSEPAKKVSDNSKIGKTEGKKKGRKEKTKRVADSLTLDSPANSSELETSEESDNSPSVLDVMDQKIPYTAGASSINQGTADKVLEANSNRQILQCSLCGWGTGLLKPSKANQKLKAHQKGVQCDKSKHQPDEVHTISEGTTESIKIYNIKSTNLPTNNIQRKVRRSRRTRNFRRQRQLSISPGCHGSSSSSFSSSDSNSEPSLSVQKYPCN